MFSSGNHRFAGTVLAVACLATPAAALDLSSVQKASGVWELSRDNGARKCSIQLRTDSSSHGNAVGLPPGCRHAMPAVANVVNWSLTSPDRIALGDRGGVAILAFKANGAGLVATGPAGETYVLMTAADVAQGAARPGALPAAPTRPPGPTVRPADVPGRYSVLRETTKDTGCMLTLNPGGKAQLAPACRDNGFVIFEPQAWTFAGNKLRLTARKGHHATFEMTADGTWQKDEREGGKALGFRKM